ncbi:MAG: DUF4037 domain-containing protein [Anaerolineae bacterium]|nr:DUF4037 domain-containing protein [Anaerolineae bacterium]
MNPSDSSENSAFQIAARVAGRFAQLPEVSAVAVAGSQAAGASGAGSDVDIYVYLQVDIPAETRLAIGREFAEDVQIVDFWGPGLEWNDPQTGLHVDVIFFTTGWMEAQMERLWRDHQASMGYTTCFWHTIRVSRILFDREGWFTRLHERAQQPYPPELAEAIVRLNLPVLREIFPSYHHQIAKAAARHDLVSMNHRTAALLASVFDILFALNGQLHPGEKRLLEYAERLCPRRPADFRETVTALLAAAGSGSVEVVGLVDQLADGIERLVKEM